ncbi:MAG: hypothetical protein VST67_12700, partial [Nitrospirota bacterium]|nr:hypothetical protein [Nitrospirota bacterium]
MTRGAYSQYVSTAQWRERRWRLFSTFPFMAHNPAMLKAIMPSSISSSQLYHESVDRLIQAGIANARQE